MEAKLWHKFKLLLEATEEIWPPVVQVQGKIYFANELLQLSNGKYFIPERFFCEASTEVRANKDALDPEQKLFALGNMVDLTVVLCSSIQLKRNITDHTVGRIES